MNRVWLTAIRGGHTHANRIQAPESEPWQAVSSRGEKSWSTTRIIEIISEVYACALIVIEKRLESEDLNPIAAASYKKRVHGNRQRLKVLGLM
jgi:hypothetical protein